MPGGVSLMNQPFPGIGGLPRLPNLPSMQPDKGLSSPFHHHFTPISPSKIIEILEHLSPNQLGEGSTDTGFGFTEPNEVHFILDEQMKNTISNARQYYADHIDGLVIAYTRVST